MWSLTLPRARRASGAEKFRSSTRKDFFNSIGHQRTLGRVQAMSVHHLNNGHRATTASCPFRADTVAKVENRTPRKSRESRFLDAATAAKPFGRYEDRSSFLY